MDFAYHVHSDIGNRAVGAKVDGVRVGPGYVLKNAQVVEILTSTMWKISQEYLNALRCRIPAIQTTSARKKLKKFLKEISRQLEPRITPLIPLPTLYGYDLLQGRREWKK